MALTRDQHLALDYHYNGLPFATVTAKSTISEDNTFEGLPFIAAPDAGPPPEVPAVVPTQGWLNQTSPPNTASTLARETGDVLLMDEGFTLIEETEVLDSGLPTIELFINSTPTGGTWVLGKDYLTGAYTDGRLVSPTPSYGAVTNNATLTLVTTTPNTLVSFEWGVRGLFFGDEAWSDSLKFFVDEVELLAAYPQDVMGSPVDLRTGAFSFTRPPGTYALRWQWERKEDAVSYPLESHAWITALIIDPSF